MPAVLELRLVCDPDPLGPLVRRTTIKRRLRVRRTTYDVCMYKGHSRSSKRQGSETGRRGVTKAYNVLAVRAGFPCQPRERGLRCRRRCFPRRAMRLSWHTCIVSHTTPFTKTDSPVRVDVPGAYCFSRIPARLHCLPVRLHVHLHRHSLGLQAYSFSSAIFINEKRNAMYIMGSATYIRRICAYILYPYIYLRRVIRIRGHLVLVLC